MGLTHDDYAVLEPQYRPRRKCTNSSQVLVYGTPTCQCIAGSVTLGNLLPILEG